VSDLPVVAPSVVSRAVQPERTEDRTRRACSGVLRVGVVGYGYWGPNVVRNFHGLEGCHVLALCDKSRAARQPDNRASPVL